MKKVPAGGTDARGSTVLPKTSKPEPEEFLKKDIETDYILSDADTKKATLDNRTVHSQWLLIGSPIQYYPGYEPVF